MSEVLVCLFLNINGSEYFIRHLPRTRVCVLGVCVFCLLPEHSQKPWFHQTIHVHNRTWCVPRFLNFYILIFLSLKINCSESVDLIHIIFLYTYFVHILWKILWFLHIFLFIFMLLSINSYLLFYIFCTLSKTN